MNKLIAKHFSRRIEFLVDTISLINRQLWDSKNRGNRFNLGNYWSNSTVHHHVYSLQPQLTAALTVSSSHIPLPHWQCHHHIYPCRTGSVIITYTPAALTVSLSHIPLHALTVSSSHIPLPHWQCHCHKYTLAAQTVSSSYSVNPPQRCRPVVSKEWQCANILYAYYTEILYSNLMHKNDFLYFCMFPIHFAGVTQRWYYGWISPGAGNNLCLASLVTRKLLLQNV